MLRIIYVIEEYLRGCLGIIKTLLACIIRDDKNIPNINLYRGHRSLQDEFIRRVHIYNIFVEVGGALTLNLIYFSNKTKVWEKLLIITRDYDF